MSRIGSAGRTPEAQLRPASSASARVACAARARRHAARCRKISSVPIARTATRIAAPTTRSRSRVKIPWTMKGPRVPPPRSSQRRGRDDLDRGDRIAGHDHRQRDRYFDQPNELRFAACPSRGPPRPGRVDPRMPAYALVTIGGMASSVRAMTAGTKPMPPRPSRTSAIGKTIPSQPTDGTARPSWRRR